MDLHFYRKTLIILAAKLNAENEESDLHIFENPAKLNIFLLLQRDNMRHLIKRTHTNSLLLLLFIELLEVSRLYF